MPSQKISLFQFEDCPYCEKVRRKLKKKKIEFEKVEVPREREDVIRKELFKKSGVLTVPVIKIGEKYIGESQEIIDYLDENF